VPLAVGQVVLAHDQAVVLRQVVRHDGARAPLEVARRRKDAALVVGDLARHDATVRRRTEAYAQVHRAFSQAHRAVGQHELDVQCRVQGRELGNGRRNEGPAETQRGVHLQQPDRRGLAAGDAALQVFDLGQDVPPFGQVDLAFVGQADAPRVADHQAHAQARLQLGQQLGQPLARGRGRDVAFPRGSGQAAAPDQRVEEVKVGAQLHLFLHGKNGLPL